MQYEQRNHQVNSNTTRHLGADEADPSSGGFVQYFEGARKRSARFAESTSRLREIRTEIDKVSRETQSRPTGVLSGGDFDIAYHYLGLGLGVLAVLYSVVGSIFTLHGGGAALVAQLLQEWSVGPATALTNLLIHPRTLIALAIQAVIFVVIVGTRRYRQSWQHWTAMIVSVALTYVGWSSLLMAYLSPTLLAFTATIPALLVGGALSWALLWAGNESRPSRNLLIGVVIAGVLAGALGVPSLIHWSGLLFAWTVDQVARRLIVVG